jgi:hypothetical protein
MTFAAKPFTEPIANSQHEIRRCAFSAWDGNAFALVHSVVSIWDVSGRYGRQQDDCVLVDEAQKSGSNNLHCGWMSGRGRLFDKPNALVEQSVVAANYA